MKTDIRQIIAEFGAANVRIFMTEDEEQGFFRNPFGGRKEYEIVERRYKVADNYKIGLALIDRTPNTINAPEWFDAVLNERNFYICDFNSILERDNRIEVFVLVDEDNKYQKVA
jgi:hypothetical protein